MYFAFSIVKFKNNIRNKFSILMGILEPLLFFIVYMYIFQALFRGREQVDGYTLEMVTTSILLAICMGNAYKNHELLIQKKLKEGAFLTELMKPVDFRTRALFENIGNVVFNICFQMVPIFLIASVMTDIKKPASGVPLLLAVVSSILGYFVYWYLNLVINEMAFYDVSVWAPVVIKNGVVEIFGGMLLPMWFLPELVQQVLYVTPLPYLFQIPVNMYLGFYKVWEAMFFILVQLAWIVVLAGISEGLWNKGLNRILERGV